MNNVNMTNVNYLDVYAKYTDLYSKYRDLSAQRGKIERAIAETEEINKDASNTFNGVMSTWFNKMVRWSRTSKLNLATPNAEEQSKINSKSSEIFNKIFNKISPEDRKAEIYNYLGRMDRLSDDLYQNYLKMHIVSRDINKQVPFDITKPEYALSLIKFICGGPEAFDALPSLDLGDLTGYTGSIDFITPDMMTHAVMKFTDKLGRQGIAVCMFKEDDKQQVSGPLVQTFFQRSYNSNEWHDAGANCIPVNGCLILAGIVKVEALKNLQKLLTQKECKIPEQKCIYRLYNPTKRSKDSSNLATNSK